MEQDIDYLVARLGKIEGFGETGSKLLTVVKEKQVEPPPEEDKAQGENGEKGKASGSSGDASEESPKSDEKSSEEEARDKGSS